MSRVNRKDSVFRSDRDRLNFLERLGQAGERYDIRWRAWTLMNTHYHLLATTPRGNLSAAMRFVNGVFTQDWNRRQLATGHVFEGRFTSVLIETGHYMRNVYRYIALNPVKAGYVSTPAAWPWGSHPAIAGLAPVPELLDLEGLRACFGGATLAEARESYRDFVQLGLDAPDDLGNEFVIGSDEFRSNVRELIGDTMSQIRIPRSYRALARPPLGNLLAGLVDDKERRDRMILRAHVVHGYTQAEIARSLALHPDTVSVIIRQLQTQRVFLVEMN
jgi:putative transposase